MNFTDWYTDKVDIFRVVETEQDGITTHTREKLYSGIPCRIYRTSQRNIKTSQTTSKIEQESKIMLDNSVDIRAGDELYIYRGETIIRAFSGLPNKYYEPFGAVIPGLAHTEVALLQEEVVK